MKDLEIRGAGNLFGARQHGTMEAVGFDYFMHLLEQTIRELKGEAVEEVKTEINLKVDIQIPEDYLPQINLRLNLYKRISSAESLDEIAAIEEEIPDRFGPPPSGRPQPLSVRADQVPRPETEDHRPWTGSTTASSSSSCRRRPCRAPADDGPLEPATPGSLTPQGVMSLEIGPRTRRGPPG